MNFLSVTFYKCFVSIFTFTYLDKVFRCIARSFVPRPHMVFLQRVLPSPWTYGFLLIRLHTLQNSRRVSSHSTHNELKIDYNWGSYLHLRYCKIIMVNNDEEKLSPGHSWTLQLSLTDSSPTHSSPPCSAATFCVRIFVLFPLPHDWVQSPMIQSFHSQWTEQSIRK